ncbi:hypothetical protein MCUN1_000486 [Malassezia cuniculi]|uniref:Splicing factor Cactin n=1 Tax=Malassezia cuniculi TaxID=948313 RepID=A0AAF0J4Z3_9BASI|nr:hypothetical protein MCUN1_000486 [Malassezia cuniculi]
MSWAPPAKRLRENNEKLPDEPFHWRKNQRQDAWRAKENEFLLEQAKRRASIRAAQCRARPIDLLVLNLLWASGESIDEEDEASLEIDLPPPDEIVDGMSDAAELSKDVQFFIDSETDRESLAYWREILALSRDRTGNAPARVDASISSEIDAMFAHKSPKELSDLDRSIRAKLNSGEPLDVEYWEAVLRRIVMWKSRGTLRRVHEKALERRFSRLQKAQLEEGRRQQEDLRGIETDKDAKTGSVWTDDMEPETRDATKLSYDERRLKVVTLSEFRDKLVAERKRVLAAAFVPRTARMSSSGVSDSSSNTFADQMYRRESERPLEVEEEAFDGAVFISDTYQWSERYRPRKPKCINRVNTGYEWNRYNQTHYDQDNPPPRVVQGYRFNIFYPDLIDPTKAPTYKLIREPPESGHGDTVVLRFSAGPPYEDVAFRIVDRPWEHSQRRGFRCVFERGVLQLYFNFKRLRYRK